MNFPRCQNNHYVSAGSARGQKRYKCKLCNYFESVTRCFVCNKLCN